MPVFKYRHVGEMEDRIWREPEDPAPFGVIRGTWDFARLTTRPHFSPGVQALVDCEGRAASRGLGASQLRVVPGAACSERGRHGVGPLRQSAAGCARSSAPRCSASMVSLVQTFGDRADFHPHVHALVTPGRLDGLRGVGPGAVRG